METMYFVLGMLSIIGAIVLATIVWGVVKITKLSKRIKYQEECISNIERNSWDNVRHAREDLERRVDDVARSAYNQMAESLAQSNSYTDKRIDRLVDAYFKDPVIGIPANKQVLKG